MPRLGSLARTLFLVALPVPWIAAACGGSNTSGNPGSSGEAGESVGGGGGEGPSKGGSKAQAGETNEPVAGEPGALGGSPAGVAGSEGNGGGMDAVGGQASPCADVNCPYGTQCLAGDCKSVCPVGLILCSGECIDSKTSNSFCGATGVCDKGQGPNPQTGAGGDSGLGGAGAEPAPVSRAAGENCASGFACSAGVCIFDRLLPGSDAIVTRDGFKAHCKEWAGQVCLRPWIRIPPQAVSVPADCGVPIDTTALRPVWFGDAQIQAQTFCWIATGSSSVVTTTTGGPTAQECGWMYTDGAGPPNVDCGDFRRYSTVDSPDGVPDMVWSFDLLTGGGCRSGTYSTIQCNWGN